MKKILLVLLLFIGCSSLFAGVTVKDFFGKVKVKYDGDTKWSRIEIGQELPANTLVSTGFNSQIVLDLGNAILDVLPLTRMTVDEITESQDTIKTSLILKGGKVKADVGKIEGKVNDFKIKSPVATASVRGTKFEFSGKTLKVIRGKVSFYPTKKNKVNKPDAAKDEEDEDDEGDDGLGVDVSAGGQTQMTSANSAPASTSSMAKSASSVSASTKPEVVKTTTTTTTLADTTTDDVPTAADIPTVTEGTANITITITIDE